jgi:hypothetical protein
MEISSTSSAQAHIPNCSNSYFELLKLGYRVAQSIVSRYMIPREGRPRQGWKTFLMNHADVIVAIDMLAVWRLACDRLYAFVVLAHGRRTARK